MLIYDSHCHLDAVKNSKLQGKIAIPAVNLTDLPELIKYRQQNLYAKIGCGLHPWFIDTNLSWERLKSKLYQLILDYKPNFIGETGLDANKPNFDLQKQSLAIHLEAATNFNLPIIIHCVRAYNELLQILAKFSHARGIVHAYTGNRELASQLAHKNMLLGIGSIILNNNSQLVKSAAKIPDEQLILETDAPYMPALNKSSAATNDCLIYAQRLAQLKGKKLFEIISQSNNNWQRMFD